MKIVCFGDSITGFRPDVPYLHQYIKWPDILCSMLSVQLSYPVTVLNRGYAGDSTEAIGNLPGALNRLESEVIAEQPQVVVILLGANDAGAAAQSGDSTAEARFETNLGFIVSRLLENDIKVLLLQYHQTRSAEAETGWHHGNRFNDAIERVAKAQGVPVVAMEPDFAHALERYRPEELLDPVDGIHLRPAGELVYAEIIFRALKSKFPALFS